ncbi:probable purine permease 11 [Phragmites australis]|uniref:probable purine permease 11 n=1 Tax=Phragmites australis TaxID=29695 RepID=UPI002D79DA65|nr:probable purine permease 11 [Phragmites australis]
MADSNNNGATSTNNGEVQVQIPGPSKAEGPAPSESSEVKNWRWWFMVSADVLFLIVGQTSATLLERYYFSQGGSSKWISTFVKTAGFPILFFGLFFFPSKSSSTQNSDTPIAKIALIYIVLGLIIAADDMMYSNGLLYLPVSTYSLICASQLAFNVVFSYVLNSQKLTGLVLNSVVLLTLSALLLGVNEESYGSAGVSRGKYILGFLLTLGASGTYSLILSLMQLTFENVVKKHSCSAVLNMQIYTALVATFASLCGLFASGEWKSLKGEMDRFKSGQFSYLMTLVWTSVSWQVASVGMVGLIFEVSSLFSNVISTFALPIAPLFGVMIFHDKMNGVKIIAMLISLWGFVSYVYQHYLDDKKARKAVANSA